MIALAVIFYATVGIFWFSVLEPYLRLKYDFYWNDNESAKFHRSLCALFWPVYLFITILVMIYLIFVDEEYSITAFIRRRLDKLAIRIDNFWSKRINKEKFIDEAKSSYRNISYMEKK